MKGVRRAATPPAALSRRPRSRAVRNRRRLIQSRRFLRTRDQRSRSPVHRSIRQRTCPSALVRRAACPSSTAALKKRNESDRPSRPSVCCDHCPAPLPFPSSPSPCLLLPLPRQFVALRGRSSAVRPSVCSCSGRSGQPAIGRRTAVRCRCACPNPLAAKTKHHRRKRCTKMKQN